MTTDASSPETTHLIFQSGGVWYAVPASATSEIVDLPSLRQLPGSPPHVLGVFVHQAEVIPAIDLAVVVANKPSGGRRAVLIQTVQGTLGIVANEVGGVSAAIGPMAPTGSSGIQLHLLGPARARDKKVLVIDVGGLAEFLSRR